MAWAREPLVAKNKNRPNVRSTVHCQRLFVSCASAAVVDSVPVLLALTHGLHQVQKKRRVALRLAGFLSPVRAVESVARRAPSIGKDGLYLLAGLRWRR